MNKDSYRYWLGVGLLAGGLGAAVTVGAGVAAADSGSADGDGSDSSSTRESRADGAATTSESRQPARERGLRIRANRPDRDSAVSTTGATATRPKADRSATDQDKVMRRALRRVDRQDQDRPAERVRRMLSAAKADRDAERDTVRRQSRRQWATARDGAAEAPSEVPKSVRPRQDQAVETVDVETTQVTAPVPAALTKVQAKIQEKIQAQVQAGATTVVQSRLQAQRVPLGEQLRIHLTNLRERLLAGIFTPMKPPVSSPPEMTPSEVVTPKPPTLIWESNFDNLDDAQRHWQLQSGRWGEPGGENQYYTPDGSNVWVNEDGVLVIEARRETPPDGRDAPDDYTSARVVTYEKVSVEANSRIVARIKMPYTEGILPAFWMVGEEPGHHFDWPRQGEVDIVEVPGFATAEGRRMWYGNIHGPARTDNTTDVHLQGIQRDLGVDLSEDFHDYGIDWYSDRIVWHVDGVQVGQVTRAEYEAMGGDWTPFSGAWPHYLIMNVAVGNPWTGDPDPDQPFAAQQMQVDWVRVYQLEPV